MDLAAVLIHHYLHFSIFFFSEKQTPRQMEEKMVLCSHPAKLASVNELLSAPLQEISFITANRTLLSSRRRGPSLNML